MDYFGAIGLLVAGGIIGILAQFVQRRWTREDALDATRQEAQLRKEQDDREARRFLRRERVQTIRDYVSLAREYKGRHSLDRLGKQTLQALLDRGGEAAIAEQLGVSRKRVRGLLEGDVHSQLTPQETSDLFKECMRAMFAASTASPTQSIDDAVTASLQALREEGDVSTLTKLEDLLDKYESDG